MIVKVEGGGDCNGITNPHRQNVAFCENEILYNS